MIKMGAILFRVLSIKWFSLIEDFHMYQRKANKIGYTFKKQNNYFLIIKLDKIKLLNNICSEKEFIYGLIF